MAFDVVVVGGGIVGRSVTLELARQNLNVAWIFSDKEARGSASAASGAMLSTVSETYLGEQSASLAARLKGQSEYDCWLDSLGVNRRDLGYISGTFVVANQSVRNESGNLDLIRRVAETSHIVCQTIEPKGIPGFLPQLNHERYTAVYLPAEGALDSGRLLAALNTAIRQRSNVRMLVGEVEKLIVGEPSAVTVLRGERIESREIVVACGARSGAVLAASGLSDVIGTPIFAGRGVSAILADNPGISHVIRTPNRRFACGLHTLPRADGKVYVGATNRFSLTAAEATAPTVGEVITLLRQATNELNERFFSSAVSSLAVGNRPVTLDHLPLVGRSRHPQIHLATATYRNGICLAPQIAALVTAEILSAEGNQDHPFSPCRHMPLPLQSDPIKVHQAASDVVEAILELQEADSPRFSDCLYGLAVVAMSSVLDESRSVAEVTGAAKRLLSTAQIDEAIPSGVELLARSALLSSGRHLSK